MALTLGQFRFATQGLPDDYEIYVQDRGDGTAWLVRDGIVTEQARMLKDGLSVQNHSITLRYA